MDARLYQAKAALEELRGVAHVNAELADAFGLTLTTQAAGLADLLAQLVSMPENLPNSWLTTATLDDVDATVLRLSADIAAVRGAERAASALAGRSWAAVPTKADLPVVPVETLTALNPSALLVEAMTAEDLVRLGDGFARDADTLEERAASLSGIVSVLGLPQVVTFAEADSTLEVAALAQEADRPLAEWLSTDGLGRAQSAATRLESLHLALVRDRNAAETYYTDDAIGADIEGLHRRFTEDHRGLRKLGGKYRTDKEVVADFTADGVERRDALTHLDLALAWKRATELLRVAEDDQAAILGSYYAGPATDWPAIARACEHARTARRSARTDDLTVLARSIALDAPPNHPLQQVVEQTRDELVDWTTRLAPVPLDAARPELREGSLAGAVAWLRAHVPVLAAAAAYTTKVSEPLGRTLTYGQATEQVRARSAVDAAHDELALRGDADGVVVGGLYAGAATDLGALVSAVRWVRGARALLSGTDTPFTIDQVTASQRVTPTPGLAVAAQAWSEAGDSLISAFSPSRTADITGDLRDYEDAASLLADLDAHVGGKDEWFSYTEARRVLAAHGLDLAVDFCIRERVPADHVSLVLERALLQEWADHHLAGDTALATVRAEDRNALIDEYRQLDKALIGTASSDVIRAVNSRRPNTDIGESSIIQREAVKKSRHLPVRTLIAHTRHVTQAIKPVFMMSPLAVSQYLPPDMTFDTVIFDEASQVSPADAINCIYRGRALITAGDQKQLPPTSFFSAATSAEEDGDWDEDVDDFESVLDLAKSSGSFRSLTLRWHYRSRHEDLISFSNASFYDGRLITFPGAQEDGPDVGVEHFQVPGVYRRGSSRDNPVEARKVAERVLHHYATRPNLTLGVVTFSEAQATAIESALDDARGTHPDLDRHFTDDRLGGFFVKSLEAVQGDERDVMIFSLGYGPDENGKMTQNFGPLNRAGGWRRLNVAVTRARCRDEIISSFGASAIPADATSEGVRHLRRYLDFAARGDVALGLDMTDSLGDAESPFEESVLTAIRSWGYDVAPQIGAAGYRIDMAVRYPDRSGAYALGIECDGFMYHSSKVARDRDRLREQVLRGLGWHLHRIWGTAWYRSRGAEEVRLRAAIEQALRRPVRGLLSTIDDQIERPTVYVETVVLPDTPAWTQPYRTAAVSPLGRWVDPSQHASRYGMAAGVLEVVAVEGPVHIDLLTQRLREAWNIGRVGSRIRENIFEAVRASGVALEGSFLSLPDNLACVRTPGDGVTRTVEQVPDSELASALVLYVRDSGAVSSDDVLTAVARLFGWNRRGPDISARLTAVLQRLRDEGQLTGTPNALTVAV